MYRNVFHFNRMCPFKKHTTVYNHLASGELTNRPIAVVILTILLIMQVLAFAPAISSFFPSCAAFNMFSVVHGSMSVLAQENVTASQFMPELFDTEKYLDGQVTEVLT